MKGLTSDVRVKLKNFLTMIAESETESPSWTDASFRTFTRNGITYSLHGAEADQFEEYVRLLAPDDGRPTGTGPYAITELLNNAVARVLGHSAEPIPDRVRAALRDLDSALREPLETFRVGLPVAGLRIESKYQVGPVLLLTDNQFQRSKMTSGMASEFRTAAASIEPRADAWALVSVRARDSAGARDLASYHVQLALDVVNFYAGYLEAPPTAAVYQPGVRSFLRVVSIVETNKGHELPGFAHAGPFPIEMRPLHRAAGYRALQKLIAVDPSLNDAEERMLSALRWIGRGAIAPWPEQAFLFYVVSLESLLLGPRKDTELSYRFRLHGARLLARPGYKRQIYDGLNELYSTRSQIVHQGSLRVPQRQVLKARRYATIALLTLLRDRTFHRLASHQAIDEWFLTRNLADIARRDQKLKMTSPK